MKTPKYWVVINKSTAGTDDEESVRIFGSIRKIADAKLMVDNEPLTYDMLRSRISKVRFWTSDKWIITECELLRSKVKTENKIQKLKKTRK